MSKVWVITTRYHFEGTEVFTRHEKKLKNVLTTDVMGFSMLNGIQRVWEVVAYGPKQKI